MPFPRRLLFEGEEIVLDLRPHWWYFAGPAALLAVALLALVVVAVGGPGSWATIGVAGIAVAALLWFVGRYLRWMRIDFVLTSDRVVYRAGVFGRRGIEIPLDRVNTVFSHQSIFERILGNGDLVVESGGEQGHESFSHIPKPAAVQNAIEQQIERYRGRNRAEPQPDVVDQLARLDDLRKRGVVTDAEFQAKKAQLLDRL